MKKGTFNVEVAVAASHEHPRGDAVDNYSDSCYPGYYVAVDSHRMEKLLHALEEYQGYRHVQDKSIGHRSLYSALPIAVGVAVVGLSAGCFECDKGYHKRHNIAEIVAGIGKQSHGIVDEAERCFNGDICKIEPYAYIECLLCFMKGGRVGGCMYMVAVFHKILWLFIV